MHLLSDLEPFGFRGLGNGGFLLVEAAVTSVVLGVAMVSLMTLFFISAKSNKIGEQTAVASQLAGELLEEVKARKWDQTQLAGRPGIPAFGRSALGPDPGENAADKRTFNDVDDFNGWTEQPALDPVMRPLSGMQAYQRSVMVEYVTSDLQTSAAPTDYKHVQVCARKQGVVRTCLDWIATRH